ncbi:MAG TPA: hypothetical protein VKZ49_02385, partial [Polyangiaceae bacterium]|nr:hypothetical protein [Polyangiaceae bacterium]
DQGRNTNDLGHLIGSLERGGGMELGFLHWGGQGDPEVVTGAFANMVTATGESGCGFEASLEAWYRFLIDPLPPRGLVNQGKGVDVERHPDGMPIVDEVLLAQRAAFLRPDSLVAIIMLSDENDCSIAVPGNGWVLNHSEPGVMWKPTSACDEDPNSPCCRSCNSVESAPPAGCQPLSADPNCAAPINLSRELDHPNLRCFDQKRRFGLDLLFPTARYAVGLKKAQLCPLSRYGDADCDCGWAKQQDPNAPCTVADTGIPMDNPLYAAQGGSVRDPSLVFLAGIVGVPWQSIATEETRDVPGALTYRSAKELRDAGIWQEILGDPRANVPPSNPLMRESVDPRSELAPPDAARWSNPSNSHEYLVPDRGDLQYACVFELPEPRDCLNESGGCDCDEAFDPATSNPLCQAPDGSYGNTQHLAKAYPGLRQLDVLSQLGENSIVASICPKVTSGDREAPSYGYTPAVAAIVERIKIALNDRCLPRKLDPDVDTKEVPCKVVEALPPKDGCTPCDALEGRDDPEGRLVRPVLELLSKEGRCSADGAGGEPRCSDMCLCEIEQTQGASLEACQNADTNGGFTGFCYVDPEAGAGNNPALVANCPPAERRIVRFGRGTPQAGATTVIACAGATFRTDSTAGGG